MSEDGIAYAFWYVKTRDSGVLLGDSGQDGDNCRIHAEGFVRHCL